MKFFFICLVVMALVLVTWPLLRATRRRRHAAARQEFLARRGDYERAFFAAASASGKPRGLRWKECRFDEGALFARDRATGDQIALVGVTISFEAIEGGDMEEVEAVGNLRCATAVFNHNGRDWTTAGRAVFNLEPREVLERFADSLESAET